MPQSSGQHDSGGGSRARQLKHQDNQRLQPDLVTALVAEAVQRVAARPVRERRRA
ncbi:MAG TPA: hypothetical protein VGG16_21350 [Streptosporangiaceae bacterium]